jgi:TRAP-type C4-dicarboxylate transport system permease small subunit
MRKRITDFFYNMDYVLSGVCFVCVVLITVLGVIFRRFLNAPFPWLEEMQLFFFVWSVFTGASAAVRTGNHVAIDLVVDLLPESIKKLATIIIYIITMIVLGYISRAGVQLMQQAADKLTPYLHVSYIFIDLAVPIGCILMMIHYTLITYTKVFMKIPEREEPV